MDRVQQLSSMGPELQLLILMQMLWLIDSLLIPHLAIQLMVLVEILQWGQVQVHHA